MHSTAHKILDLIFPRFCIECNGYIEEFNSNRAYICQECANTIKQPSTQKCAFCQSPSLHGRTCPFCAKDHFLNQLIVATDYDNKIVQNAIHKFKYDFIKLLANDLGYFLVDAFEKHYKENTDDKNIIVIPMPLHWSRQNWRGFNQAELLAAKFQLDSDISINLAIVKRNFQFEHQAELESREDRIKNAQNVFYINKSEAETVKNKVIIIIDDVSTTGSTLDELARTLKHNGASKVIGLVLSRGL